MGNDEFFLKHALIINRPTIHVEAMEGRQRYTCHGAR